MDPTAKNLLTNAVQACLLIIRKFGPHYQESHLVYSIDSSGYGYQGTYAPIPSLWQIFNVARVEIGATAAEFAQTFRAAHPEQCKNFICSIQSFRLNLECIPWHIAVEAWGEAGPECGPEVVERLVQGFVAFVDAAHIRIRFSAQLINFTGVNDITLPDGLVVRRQSDKEFTEAHGGTIVAIDFKLVAGRARGTFHVIEGYYDEPKLIVSQSQELVVDFAASPAVSRLEKAILAFRTFKGGQVGYSHIDFGVEAYGASKASIGHNDLPVPRGIYNLGEDEVAGFLEHAALIQKVRADTSIDLACRRLADAETRNRPEDRIIDAVIAMEALLLAPDANRNDLALRFCLNYALLFRPEERMAKYEEAKAFYDIRSIMAHGSRLDPKKIKVKGEPAMTLDTAAKRVASATRHVIHHFLRHDVPYETKDFWIRQYLGIPEPPPRG